MNNNDIYIFGEWLRLKRSADFNDGGCYLAIRTILPGMYLIRKIEDDEDSY